MWKKVHVHLMQILQELKRQVKVFNYLSLKYCAVHLMRTPTLSGQELCFLVKLLALNPFHSRTFYTQVTPKTNRSKQLTFFEARDNIWAEDVALNPAGFIFYLAFPQMWIKVLFFLCLIKKDIRDCAGKKGLSWNLKWNQATWLIKTRWSAGSSDPPHTAEDPLGTASTVIFSTRGPRTDRPMRGDRSFSTALANRSRCRGELKQSPVEQSPVRCGCPEGKRGVQRAEEAEGKLKNS